MADETPAIFGDSVPKAIMTGVQYVVTAVCSYALGRQWFQADTVALIALLTPPIVAGVYGVFKTIKTNETAKAIINDPRTNIPPEVAQVKP